MNLKVTITFPIIINFLKIGMKPITEEDIRADIVRKLPNENLENYSKVIINLVFYRFTL